MSPSRLPRHVPGDGDRQVGRVLLPLHRAHRLDQFLAPLVEPVDQRLALLEPVGGVDRPVRALDVPVGGEVRPRPALEPDARRVHEAAARAGGAAEAVDRLPVERLQALVGNGDEALRVVVVPPVAVGLHPGGRGRAPGSAVTSAAAVSAAVDCRIAVGDADDVGAGVPACLLAPGGGVLTAGQQVLDPHRDAVPCFQAPGRVGLEELQRVGVVGAVFLREAGDPGGVGRIAAARRPRLGRMPGPAAIPSHRRDGVSSVTIAMSSAWVK